MKFLRSSPDPDHRRVVHFRCGWLPTHKRVSRFVTERPTTCPRCRHYLETVDHLLRCPQSEPLLIDFINDTLAPKLLALSTDPEIKGVALLLGLRHWSRFGDNEVVWDETSFRPIINQALQDQCNIGWDLLLRGFPAKRWTIAQDRHYASTPHNIEKTSGLLWGSTFISSLLEFFFLTWKHRNGVLHGNTPEEQEAIRRTRLIIRLNEIFLLHDSTLPQAQIEIFKQSKVDLENGLTPSVHPDDVRTSPRAKTTKYVCVLFDARI
jgi:hypothetical protein